MKILFASAHPYLPEIMGGSQVNTHEIAQGLVARGHQVAVLAGLIGAGLPGWRDRLLLKITKRRVCVHRHGDYLVYRGWHAWEGVDDCVEAFRPDIAIVQSGSILRLAEAFRSAHVPAIIYNHNIEFDDHGAGMDGFLESTFIANSEYTARRYRDNYGVASDVIVPFFNRSRYAVESRREDVLFINPHPQKGVAIALALADRFPELPFRFVRGWPLNTEEEAMLRDAEARLPNLRIFESTDHMSQHYACARLLLVPSQWEETWGRVVTEAHFSGIPVLATRIGGLPEAVGPGGILIDPEAGVEQWADALQVLWNDPLAYGRYASAAITYGQRPEIDPSQQLDHLERLIKRALS